MTILVQAPLSPRAVGSKIRTSHGVGTIVDYRCPNGAILYVVDVDLQQDLFEVKETA